MDNLDYTVLLLERSKIKTAHLFHFIMTVIFFPWVLVWILFAVLNAKYNKQVDMKIIELYAQRNQQEEDEHVKRSD